MKQAIWYRPELDILRFTAFLGVFVFHATGANGGFRMGSYGVDLFFVLSAYLITEVLLREERTRKSFDIKAFYLRRILRIWPLYFTFLAISFWIAPLLLHNEFFSWPACIMHVVFLGNWVFLVQKPFPSVATILWSVSVEEQFYLTWPLALRWFRPKIGWICLGLLAVASCYRLAIVHWHAQPEVNILWRTTFSRIDAIVLGSLLALYLGGKTPQLSPLQRWLLGSGSLFGLFLGGTFGSQLGLRSLVTYPAMAVFCLLLLTSVLSLNSNYEEFTWPLRLLVHLGRISYGLYVFHYFCLHICRQYVTMAGSVRTQRLVQDLAALFLTIGISECSYWFLEKPFLRLKIHFSAVHTGQSAVAGEETLAVAETG